MLHLFPIRAMWRRSMLTLTSDAAACERNLWLRSIMMMVVRADAMKVLSRLRLLVLRLPAGLLSRHMLHRDSSRVVRLVCVRRLLDSDASWWCRHFVRLIWVRIVLSCLLRAVLLSVS